MTTTEKTAAVALCKAVREHFFANHPMPGHISTALSALERAINAAELGMGREATVAPATPAPSAVGEGWRELGPDEVVQFGDECFATDIPCPPACWEEVTMAGGRANYTTNLRFRRRIETPALLSTETAPGLGMPAVDEAARAAKLPEAEAEPPAKVIRRSGRFYVGVDGLGRPIWEDNRADAYEFADAEQARKVCAALAADDARLVLQVC